VPKRSEEHLEARRRQILDGARVTFARYGYEGATVAKLEEEIGLSRGAIFNYYPSKYEIFYALASEQQAEALEIWQERGFEALLREIAEENPEWLGVYLEHVRHLRTDPELRARWQNRTPDDDVRARDHMVELQASGESRDDVSAETIGKFLGLLADGIALQTSAGFPVDLEPMLGLIRDAIAPRK
jgi:TetR/AcrR family transcriptional regulator, transcriptional repressor of aconitase